MKDLNEYPTPRSDSEGEHAANIALWCSTGKHGYKEDTHAIVVPIEVARDLERRAAALREALDGMLPSYIELKRISLYLANSDAPNWCGRHLTVDDDVNVIAARAVLDATKP